MCAMTRQQWAPRRRGLRRRVLIREQHYCCANRRGSPPSRRRFPSCSNTFTLSLTPPPPPSFCRPSLSPRHPVRPFLAALSSEINRVAPKRSARSVNTYKRCYIIIDKANTRARTHTHTRARVRTLLLCDEKSAPREHAIDDDDRAAAGGARVGRDNARAASYRLCARPSAVTRRTSRGRPPPTILPDDKRDKRAEPDAACTTDAGIRCGPRDPCGGDKKNP